MHKLIITADDYGMCEAVNEAIEACAAAKVVLSTNVMTNMPYCEAASELKKKFPYLSVGLHYNFTVGKPLSPAEKVSTLIDGRGDFLTYEAIREAYKKHAYSHEQIMTEMKAQYIRYVEILGEPDYWNTHENVHVYPGLYALFCDVSLEFGIRRMRSHQRIYLPSSDNKTDKSWKWKLTDPIKRSMLNKWQNSSLKKGISAPDGIIVRMNEDDKLKLEYVFKNISWKNSTTGEIAIHPALTGDCEHFGNITDLRVKEYEVFSNPDVCGLASRCGIELVNFDLK